MVGPTREKLVSNTPSCTKPPQLAIYVDRVRLKPSSKS